MRACAEIGSGPGAVIATGRSTNAAKASKLLEQRRVDDRKDRRRGPNAESERSDGGRGEARRAPHPANRKADVAREFFDTPTSHFVARALAPLLASALPSEIQHGRSARVVRRHAQADVPLSGHVDVKVELAVQARIELAGATEAEEAADGREQARTEACYRHGPHSIARMSSTARESRRHACRSSASRV